MTQEMVWRVMKRVFSDRANRLLFVGVEGYGPDGYSLVLLDTKANKRVEVHNLSELEQRLAEAVVDARREVTV